MGGDPAAKAFNPGLTKGALPVTGERPAMVWDCPDCAFSFDIEHRNVDGTYSCPVCAEARLVKEIERLRALLEEAATNPEGDYYLGLRCGVEDRDIHDRYDAAEYGWDRAFEYVASVVAGGSDSERSGEANG